MALNLLIFTPPTTPALPSLFWWSTSFPYRVLLCFHAIYVCAFQLRVCVWKKTCVKHENIGHSAFIPAFIPDSTSPPLPWWPLSPLCHMHLYWSLYSTFNWKHAIYLSTGSPHNIISSFTFPETDIISFFWPKLHCLYITVSFFYCWLSKLVLVFSELFT